MDNVEAFRATRARLIELRDAAIAHYDAGIVAIDEAIEREAKQQPMPLALPVQSDITTPTRVDGRLGDATLADAAYIALSDTETPLHIRALWDWLSGHGYTQYSDFKTFRGSAIPALKRDYRLQFLGNNTFGLRE